MKTPNTMKGLRDDLLQVYTKLRNQELNPSEAKEAVNTAGKILSSCKVQMEYAKIRGESPDIPFIEGS